MASFAQNQPVQFTHYIPKYSTELYGQVGMFKQGKYEEGVRQAQGYIDSVAGLPIYRDTDKQYLQSKLKDMETKSAELTGADYSIQSVVSKIKTQAAAAANDSVVQNAVSSTLAVKSFLQSQKELKEKHPELYPVSWEEDQNSALMAYMNDSNPGAIYRGSRTASTYTDYRKDLTEQLKEIDPTITTEISPDGKFQWKTEKHSEINSQTIKGIISSYLATNPGAQKSMFADAKYTYKNDNPITLSDRINTYTQSTIQALQEDNAHIIELMKANPGSIDFLHDQQKKLLDNANHIKELENKRTSYLKDLGDPANINRIKMNLFSDNFMSGQVLRFSKEDTERSISENINAVRDQAQDNADRTFGLETRKTALAFMKEGLNPDGTPMDTNSPYWSWWMSTQVKGKSGKSGSSSGGGAGSDGIMYSDNPQNAAETNKNNSLDQSGFQSQIKATMESIGEREDGSIVPGSPMDRLRQRWFKKAGTLDSNFNRYTPEQKQAQFDNYYKTQSANFKNGKDTEPLYKEFRQMTFADQTKLTMMNTLNEEANSHAVQAIPVSGGAEVSIMPYVDPNDGKTVNKIYIPHNSSLSKLILDFNKKFDEIKTERYSQSTTLGGSGLMGGTSGVGDQWSLKAASPEGQRLLASYRNHPEYERLARIVNSPKGMQDINNKVVSPLKEKAEERQRVADEYLKMHGRGFNVLEYAIDQKTENVNQVKNEAYNDLVASKGVVIKSDGEKDEYDLGKHGPDDKDFVPISSYRGNDGKMYWKVKIGKGEPVSILSTKQVDELPNSDPLDWLVKSIDMYGETPSKGDGVLTTYSGRVRYKISKGFANGTYEVDIIDKGIPYNIELHTNPTDQNSPIKKIHHPKQIMDAISEMETKLNQTFNIRSDSEDALKALTLSDSEFLSHIKTKYRK